MSKRATLTLSFAPLVLFGLLLFLGRTMVVSGNGLERQALSMPGDQLLQLDPYEPNNTVGDAFPINVGDFISDAEIEPAGDIDFFVFSTIMGQSYRAEITRLDDHLRIRLYDGNGLEIPDKVDVTDSTDRADITWSASFTTYYVSIEGKDGDDIGRFNLRVAAISTEPTRTSTATPVPWDDCEINDSINGSWPGGPCQLAVGMTETDLNFLPSSGQPVPNNDYFIFLAKAGRAYRITTEVSGGADTEMWLYDPSNVQIAYDDDGGPGQGSRIERTLGDGFHKILVRDRLGSASPPTGQTYNILVEDVTPGPTGTPLPGTVTATPTRVIRGQPDAFEPNYDFNRATLIGLATKYTNLNFVPWTGVGQDNDFYKLWVVAGKLYTCETSELDEATNTNMIICSGPSWEQCFAGNDDVQPFDPNDPYRSRLTFFSSYSGYLYIIMGQVGADRILPEEWARLSYSLQCYIDQPGTATPTPTSQAAAPPPQPTSTPESAVTPDQTTPVPSPTPLQLVVLPKTTPRPPSLPTPAATPTPELYVIEMLLYYDRNDNGQMDGAEGIKDMLARAYDAISGDLLSIDYTDEAGYLRFTVPGKGPVRVSVPFLGFNQIVTVTNTSIQIRVSPRP